MQKAITIKFEHWKDFIVHRKLMNVVSSLTLQKRIKLILIFNRLNEPKMKKRKQTDKLIVFIQHPNLIRTSYLLLFIIGNAMKLNRASWMVNDYLSSKVTNSYYIGIQDVQESMRFLAGHNLAIIMIIMPHVAKIWNHYRIISPFEMKYHFLCTE